MKIETSEREQKREIEGESVERESGRQEIRELREVEGVIK